MKKVVFVFALILFNFCISGQKINVGITFPKLEYKTYLEKINSSNSNSKFEVNTFDFLPGIYINKINGNFEFYTFMHFRNFSRSESSNQEQLYQNSKNIVTYKSKNIDFKLGILKRKENKNISFSYGLSIYLITNFDSINTSKYERITNNILLDGNVIHQSYPIKFNFGISPTIKLNYKLGKKFNIGTVALLNINFMIHKGKYIETNFYVNNAQPTYNSNLKDNFLMNIKSFALIPLYFIYFTYDIKK
jgi:hypothetical protein